MQSTRVVILGTGGTIAGAAPRAEQALGYQAGALDVGELIAAVPALQGRPLEAESVARLDSCDMDHATWAQLAARCAHHLARAEVAGVVVTHGTDTLEETAYFLHRVLAPCKPLVLTAAMRPATALSADGPRNLLDAVTLAQTPGAQGVLVAFGGRVIGAPDLRKLHGWRVDAFSAGDAGDVGAMEDGSLRRFRDWPQGSPDGAALLALAPEAWPRVDLLLSHAGVRGELLDAAVAGGAQGIVIAGTGNGTVHHGLLAAARRAQQRGVPVWRSSRCLLGGVVGADAEGSLPSAGPLTPMQARVELMLRLAAGKS
jgi:L-asparaginase